MRSSHPKQRRPDVAYHAGLDFGRAARALNGAVQREGIITEHMDKRGRVRQAGAGPVACALHCLFALARLQRRGQKKGSVYVGLEGLGREFRRSRSTAYRSQDLLVRLGLIVRESGGGKEYRGGQLVARANGYQLAPELRLPEGHARRSPGHRKRAEAVDPTSPGQQLAEKYRQQFRDRAGARAGP